MKTLFGVVLLIVADVFAPLWWVEVFQRGVRPIDALLLIATVLLVGANVGCYLDLRERFGR